jgi:DNA-binding CsgD family transcriptional regulator
VGSTGEKLSKHQLEILELSACGLSREIIARYTETRIDAVRQTIYKARRATGIADEAKLIKRLVKEGAIVPGKHDLAEIERLAARRFEKSMFDLTETERAVIELKATGLSDYEVARRRNCNPWAVMNLLNELRRRYAQITTEHLLAHLYDNDVIDSLDSRLSDIWLRRLTGARCHSCFTELNACGVRLHLVRMEGSMMIIRPYVTCAGCGARVCPDPTGRIDAESKKGGKDDATEQDAVRSRKAGRARRG